MKVCATNKTPFVRLLPYAVIGTLWLAAVIFFPGAGLGQPGRSVTDSSGRVLTIPDNVNRGICSGSGCLRLLTYLGAHDRIVAVDSIEVRGSPIDARPYAIANPRFKTYPIFGEFRGHDNPELIANLSPQPQVVFKTVSGRGADPDLLQTKTGIPVITLDYGNLTYGRASLDRSLRLMADVMGVAARAEAVIAYFNALEQDLRRRTQDVPANQRPTCFIGGLGQSGPHGFQSTEPSFAPFAFIQAKNVADPGPGEKPVSHATVAKEKILVWDPEVIFIDISTMRLGAELNAISQLRTDPAYQSLRAVRNGRVYGLFPYNSYAQNYETIFANAYYVGKVLYPDRFKDINPMAKAEEISVYLNGGPAFEALNRQFEGQGFSRILIK